MKQNFVRKAAFYALLGLCFSGLPAQQHLLKPSWPNVATRMSAERYAAGVDAYFINAICYLM